MDKERLRIPSDSSSGSSSRGGPSPNLPAHHIAKPAYIMANNSIGPSSPPLFSPNLPSPQRHNLPPPPGLPHPSMYQFPPSPAPGFHNMNFPLAMPISGGAPSQLPGRFPGVSTTSGGAGQYHVNGYAMQNGAMHTQTSSPPGYNYFGGLQPQHPQHAAMPQGCSMHPGQQQTCGLFSPSELPYNQSGDNFDLEKRLNLLLNSGAYDSGVSFGNDLMSNVGSHKEEVPQLSSGSILTKEDKPVSKSGGVMNPIIENLVGSMSMSNGTYTHFGPSVSSSNVPIKAQNGQSDFYTDMHHSARSDDQERKVLFSQITVPPVNEITSLGKETLFGNVNAVKVSASHSPIAAAQQEEKMECKSGVNNFTIPLGTSENQHNNNRACSPKDSPESSSRPQTPGKPSYLEVLTKAGLKSQSNSTRKTSSASPSPLQNAFTAGSESVSNLTHRKSIDYIVGSSTSSTPSSSCPSASSSPATKPRNSLSGVKGKENVSATNIYAKQSGVTKNSPSNSPAHNNIQNPATKCKPVQISHGVMDRKVLSSQNNTSGIKNGSGKGVKTSKVGKHAETEEPVEDGEWGWKTYTARGRNNNLSNVGNKNSQKRASSDNSGSDPVNATFVMDDVDQLEDGKSTADDLVSERRAGSSSLGSSSSNNSFPSATSAHSRKQRDKERPRSRKEDRNCVSRRLETLAYTWLTHLISALTWLWSLIADVASLSASLGVSLLQDLYMWIKTKALPDFSVKVTRMLKHCRQTCRDCWHRWRTKVTSLFGSGSGKSGSKPGGDSGSSKSGPRQDENILSLLGPERNISLPGSGDEALKRLLSVKGQDPYSILGVRSDSSEETIRRYYKRQAVLVHPDKNLIVGAEEAFKILARAFEMVGDPLKRDEYHQKLMEAQAKEKFCGEIGNLLEQLRKKMEAASSTIRCTKCNSRHKKSMTDRPLFAARYCSQCRIHHGAREGELWAERGGWFGITWNYFACMDAHVWEINDWARCQKTNLKHIKADAHCVMYRLVAGGNNQQNHGQNCHGNGTSCEGEERCGAGSDADEWDSLINNLCKSPPGTGFGKSTSVPGKPGCCSSDRANGAGNTAGSQAAGRRRKGKRNK